MTTFPGATALSEVSIYNWPARDGAAGGAPHLHTTSAEAYAVQQGHGRLETLDSGGFKSTPLEPGTVLWFTPGTIHRAINDSGDLRVLVVMQNAGLPENGDAVMTFPPAHLVDGTVYSQAAALTPGDADSDDPTTESAARRRRDLALEGYFALKKAVLEEGSAALADFHHAAARIVGARTSHWQKLLVYGAERQAAATRAQLEFLERADSYYLQDARTTMGQRKDNRTYGMCGRIQTWGLSENS
ncbi:mannose-6-phosphate isomerase-like protein (cupin superfamily) [Arthrobacter stackebrandtii]|uniref:Mannose-6-phosphate isomerase-like protein (Cupin superfamily) n=1 Tax=Arthrobacter stackebrandtii TaxID=272161 RepID=A0ABS4YTN7_9MICC|nr:mannose-6-phosphate isomerase-like protein (cupin superfamily) [Arthrobacter stackebrandtii]